jgi:2-polyprenyl-3-methyl-5-hydroxy-6-metoxy-1,4-benzoquinol methylase
MVMPAAAPSGDVIDERSWREAGQAQAFAAQVSVVGIAGGGGQVRKPCARAGYGGAVAGLDQCEESLEAQRPLERLGADADGGQDASSELTG